MHIRNIRHKGLRRFAEEGDPSGLDPKITTKLDQMLTFLNVMEREDELYSIPIWKPHKLTGYRKGTWSLFVTKNWLRSGSTVSTSKSSISTMSITTEWTGLSSSSSYLLE